ncbi:hypothetical protein LIER_41116 [Lithospermum erythrorhizon]|uniref:Uncharacterized protein n=1 Tax=Lithospermum erythrorhizon TaxID=34254 RepID=A0AAV3R8N2_LITER
MKSCLPNWKYVHNISDNRVGRLIVAWDSACCDVTVVEVMEQHMLCKVEMIGFPMFYLYTIYGASLYVNRRLLWRHLTENKIFTWYCNWRSREGQLRKLDHVFYNLEWMQGFPQSYVHIQSSGVSDHCPLSVTLKSDG